MIFKDQRSVVCNRSFVDSQDLHFCKNKQATDRCCDCLEFTASNGRMINEWGIGKCLEGTGHGLFEVLSGLLPGGTKETKKKNLRKVAGAPGEVPTGQLPVTSLIVGAESAWSVGSVLFQEWGGNSIMTTMIWSNLTWAIRVKAACGLKRSSVLTVINFENLWWRLRSLNSYNYMNSSVLYLTTLTVPTL
jgi:hypothetical protein